MLQQVITINLNAEFYFQNLPQPQQQRQPLSIYDNVNIATMFGYWTFAKYVCVYVCMSVGK